MEYPDLTEVERRSKRYWNIDGIPEMVMGIVFVIWGATFVLQNMLPPGSRFGRALSWIVLLAMVASGSAANWITKRLKSKYTFPRSGYVKFHEPKRSSLLLGAVLGGLTATAFGILIPLSLKNRSLADLSVLAFGAVMAVGLFFVSRRLGMRHYLWLSLLSLILGGALSLLRLEWGGIWWFFIGLGLAFAAVGGFRFRAFVRSVPIPGGNEP